MSAVTSVIFFLCYAALSTGIGYLATRELPQFGFGDGLILGCVLFLFLAMVHENIIRRQAQAKLTRHLLALKKAYDQTKVDLERIQYENRRMSNNQPSQPQEAAFTKPSFLEPIPGLVEESNLFAATKQRQTAEAKHNEPLRDEDEDDYRNLFDTAALQPEEPRFRERPEKAPVRRPPPSTLEKPVLSEAEISQVSSEVKVLHSLVEQLYSDIEPASSRTFEGVPEPKDNSTPRQPTLKGANTAPPGKLRVVNNVDEKRILDFVRDGLRKDNVDLYLQPIVSLPQRKRRFFECYNHIRTDDGTVITQEQYRQVAIDAGILSAIDNMLLFRCMQLLRKVQGQDYSIAFFCNIVLHSLLDKEFFYKFAQYLKTHALLAPSIVLELQQEDYLSSREALTTPIKILGKMGYRFALDSVTDFNMNVAELVERNFSFMKVDARLVLQLMNKGEGHTFRSFKQRMDEVDIDVVIEHIESEQMLLELLDFNIDYGQGFLFGEPRTGKEATAGLKVS